MIILAIDPGKNGAYVIGDNKGNVIACNKNPDTAEKWVKLIKDTNFDTIIIEKVHSMPGNGGVAMFTFGGHCATIYTAVVAKNIYTHSNILVNYVTPQKWQKELSLLKVKGESKSEHKNKLKEKATNLFTNIKVTLINADALLIYKWGILSES